MKFAKELEEEAVPEWRIKYLDYKAGKKHVKAIAKAIGRHNLTPASVFRSSQRERATPQLNNTPGLSNQPQSPSVAVPRPAPARPISARSERTSLAGSGAGIRYGSFVLTPKFRPAAPVDSDVVDDSWELPGPAIQPDPHVSASSRPQTSRRASVFALGGIPTASGGLNGSPAVSGNGSRRGVFPRFLVPSDGIGSGISLQPMDTVAEKEEQFREFMLKELKKVDEFYRLMENQAAERLFLLRHQLHEMRNRRTDEVDDLKKKGTAPGAAKDAGEHDKDSHGWIGPLKAKIFPLGPNSMALQKMPRTPMLTGSNRDAGRDYVRKPEDAEVPYRTAKRKLKLALQEFYRGLELLKSYALLNRTAFRKLNKKYDKVVRPEHSYQFMTNYVNKAWFVNSDVLEEHIKVAEDLYARYFERGNHKVAAGKLRSLHKGRGDQSASSFRSGLLIGVGVVLAVQGTVSGVRNLFSDDPILQQRTSYLLQIYAGYFLMLYMFVLLCLDCRQWNKSKVNYSFIFELDARHHLDWRQMAQFPSFFGFLFGFFLWLNFSGYGDQSMFLYYPIILIGITLAILFLPAPILGHHSRKWLLYSHWRLVFAGLYPVEFRDFFLGDIYCSLAYSLCNVELFFCLYANDWENPSQCNSSHSRLMGFLGALPPIWRALQCVRRYYDTRNFFPHMANCGKYAMTIMSAVTLSLYRIQRTETNLALFVTFSVINSIYASFWDLFMDFSLMQTQSPNFLLRNILAFKNRVPYYVISVVDPTLRFSWIFYAIFTNNVQHSAVVSFAVSFAEITRRGAWALFRVENEHCSNVKQYKASRDVPLPYHIELLVPSMEGSTESHGAPTSRASGVDVSSMPTAVPTTPRMEAGMNTHGLRSRRGQPGAVATLRSIGTGLSRILADAHRQDFVKKRRPEGETAAEGHDDDDEEDDEDEADDDADALGIDTVAEAEAEAEEEMMDKRSTNKKSELGSRSKSHLSMEREPKDE